MCCNDDICDNDNCSDHVDDDDADDDCAGVNDGDDDDDCGGPGSTFFKHTGMCFKIQFICLSDYSFSKEKYNGIYYENVIRG